MDNIPLIINGVVGLCVVTVVSAVVVDFLFFQDRNDQKIERKSFVATFTMFCFFFLFYGILKTGIGVLMVFNGQIRNAMIVLGFALLVVGAVVNISGRFKLGRNWSDQAKIYKSQTLVLHGVYGIVRHPLYASLIWMYFGASLVYSNWLAFVANTLIFLPAMFYRAKLEEKMLAQEFPEYKNYQKKVGMFFPRI